MRFSILLALGLVYTAVVPRTAAADIDNDASVVELRSSCLVDGTMLHNCFETSADVTDWLWNGGRTSEPNSLDPVTVRVGPGAFDPFRCEAPPSGVRGFVSVLGSGRDLTHFVETNAVLDFTTFTCEGGITSIDCTNLSFSDLTASGRGTGVYWLGIGDSFWESVDMEVDNGGASYCAGRSFAWFDKFSQSTGSTPGGVHFFWNSRLQARGVGGGTAAFYSSSESWFYGADFLLIAVGGGSGYGAAVTILTADGAHIFGSTVRAVSEASFAGNLSALQSLGSGAIHMHGGIVNVNATDSVTGVAVGASTDNVNGFVHTPQTAFALKGTIKIRIYGPGTVQSPFIWPRGTTPPNVLSFTGADFFVKTDEGPGQNEARLFVYDDSCSAIWAERWRNMTTGNCL